MPKIVVLSEGFTGRTFELKSERTTVGRVDDNDFCIPEQSVSSRHCEILLRGNDVLLKDLGSTNGSFIAGSQVTEGTIKQGQIFRLGNVQCRLEGDQPAPPAKKTIDQTVVLTQGVKLNELETDAAKPTAFATDSTFAKRTNKANKIFIVVGVLLGLIVVGLLIYAIMRAGELNAPQ